MQLSPLAVLCAVLIGAQLAGILALLAIPIAGSLIAVVREIPPLSEGGLGRELLVT